MDLVAADENVTPGENAPARAQLFWIVFAVLALVQIALLAFEQRHQLSDLTTRPFMRADYSYHYYFSARQAESTLMGRGYGGWEPQMFGGMDLWPQVTPSDRLTVLLFTLTPKASWPAVFNFMY